MPNKQKEKLAEFAKTIRNHLKEYYSEWSCEIDRDDDLAIKN